MCLPQLSHWYGGPENSTRCDLTKQHAGVENTCGHMHVCVFGCVLGLDFVVAFGYVVRFVYSVFTVHVLYATRVLSN